MRTTLDLETRDDVNISVIVDGETGGLVAAYTDSTGEWPQPENEYDLEEMTRQAGWHFESSSPDSMTPNLVTLVETLIHQNATDPTEPGQVIIRPRWNSPRFPARKVGDTLVPVQGRSKYWTVQVCGLRRPASWPRSTDGKGSGFYFTEHIYQLKDRSLEFSGGFYMP